MPSRSLLLRIPPELLSQILAYLRPYESEPLARTFDTTLTPICIAIAPQPYVTYGG